MKPRKNYKHLSIIERESIALLTIKGLSAREIGRILNRDHTTISREIKRNTSHNGAILYSAFYADKVSRERRHLAGRQNRMKSPIVRSYVRSKLKLGWSPQQISGRISQDIPGESISHETIYKYLYEEDTEYLNYLPFKRQSRWPRGKKKYGRRAIPNRQPVKQRPDSINDRKDVGHWESDSILFNKGKMSLNVLVERKTRYLYLSPLIDKSARSTSQAIVGALQELPQNMRQSITYDNGSENRNHEIINQVLGMQSYFCEPYHSWEKGTVENTNSLIRRFLPKKCDLSRVPMSKLKEIERLLNNRPRKCLNYKTPNEALKSFS